MLRSRRRRAIAALWPNTDRPAAESTVTVVDIPIRYSLDCQQHWGNAGGCVGQCVLAVNRKYRVRQNIN